MLVHTIVRDDERYPGMANDDDHYPAKVVLYGGTKEIAEDIAWDLSIKWFAGCDELYFVVEEPSSEEEPIG